MKGAYQLRATLIKPMISIIASNGDSVEEAFRKLLLPVEAIDNENTFISWVCVRKLITYIDNKYNTPLLGFETVSKIGIYHLQPYLAYLHSESENLTDALLLFAELNRRYT